jgi:hypothetical protein
MKTYEGVEVYFQAFLTSALDRGEWSTSSPGYITPGEEPRYSLDKRLNLDTVK